MNYDEYKYDRAELVKEYNRINEEKRDLDAEWMHSLCPFTRHDKVQFTTKKYIDNPWHAYPVSAGTTLTGYIDYIGLTGTKKNVSIVLRFAVKRDSNVHTYKVATTVDKLDIIKA